MDVAALVSAIAAVASVSFAVFSWWRSTLSKRAKEEAELSAQQAKDRLDAIESMARSLEGPPLELTRVGTGMLRLRNRSPRGVTVTAADNVHEFLDFRMDMPVTLPSGSSVEIRVNALVGLPGQMILRVEGRSDPIHVPVPERPAKH